MTANQYFTYNPGLKLETAISSSVGVGSANKIIATDSNGKLSASFLPNTTTAAALARTYSSIVAGAVY